MDNGIFGTSKGVKGQSNVVMEAGIPIVQGDRPVDQVDSNVVAANLVGDDAKKMEAIGVILVDGKDFSVVGLCFSKFAGLMMAQRRSQQVSNLNRRVGGCARWRRHGDACPLLGCRSSLFSVHGEEPRRTPTSPNMHALTAG